MFRFFLNLYREMKTMNLQLQALTEEVALSRNVMASAAVLIAGLADQIEALKHDPERLTELATDLRQQREALAAAIEADGGAIQAKMDEARRREADAARREQRDEHSTRYSGEQVDPSAGDDLSVLAAAAGGAVVDLGDNVNIIDTPPVCDSSSDAHSSYSGNDYSSTSSCDSGTSGDSGGGGD